MSINSKVRFAPNSDASPHLTRILSLFVVTLMALTGQKCIGQQPLKHIPPLDAQPLAKANQISAPSELRTRASNFIPRAVSRGPDVLRSDMQVVRDNKVVKAAYDYDSSPAPLSSMRSTPPIQAAPPRNELPWSYELKNLSHEQFEDMLTDIWGTRIGGKALDSEKTTIRIFLPASKTSPEQTMKFDRVNRIATFEGAPSRKASWFKLMRDMDLSQNLGPNKVIRIIDIGNANQQLIQKVAYAVNQQPAGNPDPFSQDDPPFETREINYGDLTPEQLRERLKNLKLPQFPGGRQVTVIPSENGTLTLSGHPDDVAKVEQFVRELIDIQPALDPRDSEIVALNYQDPEILAEQLTGIYETQFTQFGAVEIRPIPVTRSILVVGAPGGVKQIADLARQMDAGRTTEGDLSDDEKGFDTYELKYLSPFNAKAAVDSFFGVGNNTQGNNTGLEPLPVRTVAEERANRIVIYASPTQRKRALAFLEEIDRPSATDNTRIIRIYAARNQLASNLAATVQNILGQGLQQNTGTQDQNNLNNNNNNRGGGFGGTQDSLPQSGLTSLTIVGRNGRIGDGGRSFDDRIISDDTSNTLAIVAYEETMPLITELLRQVDKIPNLTSEVKVFPVFNGDANEILDTLNQIFGGTVAGQAQAQQGGIDLPLQSPASDGASLLSLRFAVNERLNIIIASGSISDLEFVEAMINRLDEENGATRQTRIYRLSNASSIDIAASINDLLDELETLNDGNPQLGGGNFPSAVPRARRDVIVVEEEVSNTLIINAQPELFREIEAIIERLDRRPPVVKVKAMIVNIDLDQIENFGIDFGIQDSSVFSAGLSDMLGNGFVGLDNVGGQLLSDLGVGRAAPGGLVLSAGDESFNFIMRFLETKGCAKVLFRPHVMTLENLTGSFTSGASIQRLGQINNVGLGNTQQSVDNVNVGVNFSVTPRVSPDGMIVMFVDVENSSLGNIADGTVIGLDAAGNPIQSAPINQTGVQTAVMCRSGQTIAITGLISESKTENVSSVPILGKLPVIGPIFQSTENTASRTETIIVLTPYIVDGEDDYNFTNQDEFERMHWCRCDVAEAYGDTSYTGTEYREHAVTKIFPDNDPRGQNPRGNFGRQSVQQQFPGKFDDGGQAPNSNFGGSDAGLRNPETRYRDAVPQQNQLPYPDNGQVQPIDSRVPPANEFQFPAQLPAPTDGSSSRNVAPYQRYDDSPPRNTLSDLGNNGYHGGGVNQRGYADHGGYTNQRGYAERFSSPQSARGTNHGQLQSNSEPQQFRGQGGRSFTLHPQQNRPSVYR